MVGDSLRMQVHNTLAILQNQRSKAQATVLDQSQCEAEDLICHIREDKMDINQVDLMRTSKLLQESLIILEFQRDLRRSQTQDLSMSLRCNKLSRLMMLPARRRLV